jgi:DNA-directed RNA polymerase specialized sigma24 family protein
MPIPIDFDPNEFSKEYIGMFFEQLFGKDSDNITDRLNDIENQLEHDIVFAKQEYDKIAQARLEKEQTVVNKERLHMKNILVLNAFGNLTASEIAERMGLDLALVKKIIQEEIVPNEK